MPVKLPDPPYIAAGAIGGPLVIYGVTPMRNALTLGAMDASKSALMLYKDVFRGGFMSGFAGGQYMMVAAVPGFLVIGPAFHMYREMCGGSIAMATMLTALSETTVFFGSETRNAQVAFNKDAEKRGAKPIAKLQSPYIPFGSGVGFHVARNYLAMSGIRVFSKPCQDVIEKACPAMGSGTRVILGDLVANIGVSALSAPIHQLYGFSVTHRVAAAAEGGVQASALEAAKGFMKSQYLTPAGRLSSVALRDVFLRVAYNASIFSIYGAIERGFVANWPK